MRLLQAMIVASISLLAALSFGEGIGTPHPALQSQPYQIITQQLGDVDGFGYGFDVCPIGCELAEIPVASGKPIPFDAPDSPCALTPTWVHNLTEQLPPKAEILGALLLLNVAGIEPGKFSSVLTADSTVFPLLYFDQGELGSGLIPVPIDPADLSDGLLQVTIKKGIQTRTTTICDEQFYDASVLLVLIRNL
jgi:hypothetical protein